MNMPLELKDKAMFGFGAITTGIMDYAVIDKIVSTYQNDPTAINPEIYIIPGIFSIATLALGYLAITSKKE